MIYSLYYKDCEGYQCGRNIIADTDKEGKNIASKIVQGNGYEDISLCRLNGNGKITRLAIKSRNVK